MKTEKNKRDHVQVVRKAEHKGQNGEGFLEERVKKYREHNVKYSLWFSKNYHNYWQSCKAQMSGPRVSY
jgi:hypothetical protein